MQKIIPALTQFGLELSSNLSYIVAAEIAKLHRVHIVTVQFSVIDRKRNQLTTDYWKLFDQKIENIIRANIKPPVFHYPARSNKYV